MTAREKFKRRSSRQYRSQPGSVTKALSRLKDHGNLWRLWKQRQNTAKTMKNARPRLDRNLSLLLRGHVVQMLDSSPTGGFSLLKLANDIWGNHELRNIYSRTAALEDATVRTNGGRHGYEAAISKHNYGWLDAWKRMQEIVGANQMVISSWEEARAVFTRYMDLDDDVEEDDDGDKAVQPDRALLEADSTEFDLSVQRSRVRKSMKDFQKRMQAMTLEGTGVGLRQSARRWLRLGAAAKPSATSIEYQAAAEELQAKYDEHDKLHANKDVALIEERLREEELQAEARERAASLMRPLTEDERETIQSAMQHPGPPDEIIAQEGTDTIQRGSLQKLAPGEWLNDEIIHYFLVTLAKRDEAMCKKDPTKRRSHFFKSFFITKLLNEGHSDPNLDGKYDYRNVKRWSKKVPGKDIFKLDKIFFPINQGNVHWVAAMVYMQEKRIQFYDSMGSSGRFYLEQIFQYIKDEHMDKKKTPLPDADQWQLVDCAPGTPKQRNGFDCGVFTCMFGDFLSKDCPLVFGQDHVNQCRERIALAILQGQAIV